MPHRYVIVLLFFLALAAWQESHAQQLIQGRIEADTYSLEGVYVMNLVTEKATATDSLGRFKIRVSEGDLLVFTAIHLGYARKSIGEQEIERGEVVVQMYSKTIELDGVVLTEYPNINARALGIIDYEPKRYTPRGRRLHVASDPDLEISNFGVSFSLDFIINAITGRTARLKKELEVERKIYYREKLEDYFSDDFFVSHLKLPEEYIGAFKFYVVECTELREAIDNQHRYRAKFELGRLSHDFKSYYDDF
jgi:hypothetical protein